MGEVVASGDNRSERSHDSYTLDVSNLYCQGDLGAVTISSIPCAWRITNREANSVNLIVLFLPVTSPILLCHEKPFRTHSTSTNHYRDSSRSTRRTRHRCQQLANETAAPSHQTPSQTGTQSYAAGLILVRILVAFSHSSSDSTSGGDYPTIDVSQISLLAQTTQIPTTLFVKR